MSGRIVGSLRSFNPTNVDSASGVVNSLHTIHFNNVISKVATISTAITETSSMLLLEKGYTTFLATGATGETLMTLPSASQMRLIFPNIPKAISPDTSGIMVKYQFINGSTAATASYAVASSTSNLYGAATEQGSNVIIAGGSTTGGLGGTTVGLILFGSSTSDVTNYKLVGL